MVESMIFLMQVLSVIVMIAGSVLTFGQLTQREPQSSAERFSMTTANDFEVDYRRVLAFARLRVRR
jgi:hypothetical protein